MSSPNTEQQDEELRKQLADKISFLSKVIAQPSDPRAPIVTAGQLIQWVETTLHQREQEARIATWKQVRRSYPKSNARAQSVSRLTLADVDREIGELKANTSNREVENE